LSEPGGRWRALSAFISGTRKPDFHLNGGSRAENRCVKNGDSRPATRVRGVRSMHLVGRCFRVSRLSVWPAALQPKNSAGVADFSAASWTAPNWAVGRRQALTPVPIGQSAGSSSICSGVLRGSVRGLNDSRPRSAKRVLLAERCEHRPRAFEEGLSFPIPASHPRIFDPSAVRRLRRIESKSADARIWEMYPGRSGQPRPFPSADRLRGPEHATNWTTDGHQNARRFGSQRGVAGR
jgi:hypothetical protein